MGSAREAASAVGVPALADVILEAPVPLWVIGRGGTVAMANRAAAAFLGYPSELDLVGGPSHELLHRHRRDGSAYPSHECPIVRATGSGVEGDEWFLTRQGDARPVHWATSTTAGGAATVLTFSPAAFDAARIEADRRLRDAVPAAAPRPSREAVRGDLYAILRARFTDPLFTVQRFADEAHMSTRSLQLTFAEIGRTPAAELRRIRLEHARRMLERGHTVQAACRASGFLDPSSFGRAFRRHHGAAPSRVAAGACADEPLASAG